MKWTVGYGPGVDHYGELTVGDHTQPSSGVVMLLHGGFWRDDRTLALMRPLADFFAERGAIVWNVEYRRSGSRHRWPDALVDVSRALEALPTLPPLMHELSLDVDAYQVTVVGHSAGGHLALWLGCNFRDRPAVFPSGSDIGVSRAVSLAGVTDLERASAEGLGAGAAQDFLGAEPGFAPDVRLGDLRPHVTQSRLELVHGTEDDVVPIGQSRAFVDAFPDRSRLHELAVGHLELIDPEHPAMVGVWARLGWGRDVPA